MRILLLLAVAVGYVAGTVVPARACSSSSGGFTTTVVSPRDGDVVALDAWMLLSGPWTSEWELREGSATGQRVELQAGDVAWDNGFHARRALQPFTDGTQYVLSNGQQAITFTASATAIAGPVAALDGVDVIRSPYSVCTSYAGYVRARMRGFPSGRGDIVYEVQARNPDGAAPVTVFVMDRWSSEPMPCMPWMQDGPLGGWSSTAPEWCMKVRALGPGESIGAWSNEHCSGPPRDLASGDAVTNTCGEARPPPTAQSETDEGSPNIGCRASGGVEMWMILAVALVRRNSRMLPTGTRTQHCRG